MQWLNAMNVNMVKCNECKHFDGLNAMVKCKHFDG